MPIVTVNVSPAVFAEIRAYVEQGTYASPEQFLEIAAFNQAALERGSKPDDILARGHRTLPTPSRDDHTTNSRPKLVSQRLKRITRPTPVRSAGARNVQVPEDELHAALQNLVLASPEKSYPPCAATPVRPTSERMWGQINRVFPLKFACRWISVGNSSKNKWAKYETMSDRMAEDAATIGSLLEKFDLQAGRIRDDMLSTGLPKRANLPSRDRFLSQFLARTTRASEIYPGAICQYALAIFDGDRLALTDRGIELAHLANPILDSISCASATTTLSAEERSFFIDQIRRYVPGELHDMSAVVAAILDGHTTPHDLFSFVRSSLPSEWTDVMARTHVSGVVARLADLALLRRRWEGRNVTYEPDQQASNLLTEPKVIDDD